MPQLSAGTKSRRTQGWPHGNAARGAASVPARAASSLPGLSEARRLACVLREPEGSMTTGRLRRGYLQTCGGGDGNRTRCFTTWRPYRFAFPFVAEPLTFGGRHRTGGWVTPINRSGTLKTLAPWGAVNHGRFAIFSTPAAARLQPFVPASFAYLSGSRQICPAAGFPWPSHAIHICLREHEMRHLSPFACESAEGDRRVRR